MKVKFFLILFLLVTALFTTGCSTWDKLDDTEKGAVVGGGTGAVVGSAVAPGVGGAVVGGAVGAVGGGAIGHAVHEEDHERERDNY